MNVTGAEWRDLDPHDAGFLPDRRQQRPHKHAETSEEEDVVEIHGSAEDEPADGLDLVEESPDPQGA